MPQPSCVAARTVAPPNGIDAPGDLQLAETHVLRGDDDVAGQGELDGQGERDALQRQHDRLCDRLPPQPEGVVATDPGQAVRSIGADGRAHLGQVKPGGEVVAVAEDHPDAHRFVVGQPPVRGGELVDGL